MSHDPLDPATSPVSEGAIRSELKALSQSDTFIRSPQLIAFLTFIVEETLSGRGDRIKGYTIGIQALSRPHDFDPNTDPIVRVEARRLRLALKSYYAREGADDEVVINLPIGTYRPTFSYLFKPPAVDPKSLLSDEKLQSTPSGLQPQVMTTRWILYIILGITLSNQIILMVGLIVLINGL